MSNFKETLKRAIDAGSGVRCINIFDGSKICYLFLNPQGAFVNNNALIVPLRTKHEQICWRSDFNHYWRFLETGILSVLNAKPIRIELFWSENSSETLPYLLEVDDV